MIVEVDVLIFFNKATCNKMQLFLITNIFILLCSLHVFGRVCEYYNQKECESENCSKIEECPVAEADKRSHCYASWRNETGNITIIMQGCWLDLHACYDWTECVARSWDKILFCCCDADMCNIRTNISYIPLPATETSAVGIQEINLSGGLFFSYALLPLVVLSCICATLFFIWRQCRQHDFPREHSSLMDPLMQQEEAKIIQKPNAQFTHKLEIVAVGRFGCVWRAKLQTQHGYKEVALKIMKSQERASWRREIEVYELPGIKNNENILTFESAEEYASEKELELRILTEFHRRGSLHDFLKITELSWNSLLTIAESMLRGLAYLHEEVGAKPAIAHRDFKSKNVILKEDLTACIGDFGLAIIFENGNNIGDIYSQVGTHRYMAPEILDGAMCFNRDAFLRVDMYACALVLWEMTNRCTVLGTCGVYKLPYEELVGLNPTVQALNEVVTKKGRRPVIREEWRKHEGLQVLAETLDECWDVDPEARLSAYCVLERLCELKSKSCSMSSLSANGDKDSACSVSFPGITIDSTDDEHKPATGETSLNTVDLVTYHSEDSEDTVERANIIPPVQEYGVNNLNNGQVFDDVELMSAPPNVILINNAVV